MKDGTLPGPAGAIGWRRYRPFGAATGPLPTLVYYHGGGFVIGNLETHDSTCRRPRQQEPLPDRVDRLSAGARASLPPRRSTTAWLRSVTSATMPRRFDADPARLAVGGRFGRRRDGRGGVPALPRRRRANARVPDADLSRDRFEPAKPVARALAEGYFLTRTMIDWFWNAYVPAGTDLADLRLSPLLARDFTGLPTAFVLTAGHDPLRDEGRALCRAAGSMRASRRPTWTIPARSTASSRSPRFLKQGLKANDEAARRAGRPTSEPEPRPVKQTEK
ncbi:MAG: alpha/beta hydrolase fold domain-containing protein [Hyphomicrobium sp.]